MQFLHLSARRSFPVDNTIGIIFAILTLIASILSVAIAWDMWRLKRREDRLRREEAVSAQPAQQDLELQRVETNHDRNSHENDNEGNDHEWNEN